MNSLLGSQYNECVAKESAPLVRPQTPIEQLTSEKLRLEARLEDINSALEFLNKNPSFSEGLQLLSKATRGY